MEAEQGLRRLLEQYGYRAGSRAAHGMSAYFSILQKWNARVNLTASTAWGAIAWLFEEALWAARTYPSGPIRHLDIGSGAGFPALAMRILLPEMRLTLVESRARKAAFLETAAAEAGLNGTKVFCGRIEEFLAAAVPPGPFDTISWKAIRLSSEAVDLLLPAVHAEAQFWAFHGSDLPFQDPEHAAQALTRVRTVATAGQQGRYLSIFKPAAPSIHPGSRVRFT